MPGTLTSTVSTKAGPAPGEVHKFILNWTSDASGAASGVNPVGTGNKVGDPITGTLYKVQFVPGTGGQQPTDQYDITLTDQAGFDVLLGVGANLSNTTPTQKCLLVAGTDGTTASSVPDILSDMLTLSVTNAGANKSGQVILYFKN